MKKHFIYILIVILIGFTATAQIDRSKIPASGPTPEVNLRELRNLNLKMV